MYVRRAHHDPSDEPSRAGLGAWLQDGLAVMGVSCSCLACGVAIDTVAVDTLGGSGAAGTAGAAGGGSVLPSAQCGDRYPQLLWPGDAARRECTSALAGRRMSQALCSCGDIGTFGGVRTDAFDSVEQTSAFGAAAVGINGAYQSPAATSIGGSFTVASPTALPLPLLDVHGDLRLAGELRVAGPLTVGRDAWFADSATALTLVSVGRDVHQVPGKTLEESISLGTRGQVVLEDFSVAPPCRCDPSELDDLYAAIAAASTQNDNLTVGLMPAVLLEPADAVDLSLSCGNFYLDGITSSHDVHLSVGGRAALFVAGDVAIAGQLRVELAAGAELDWFVEGRLDLATAVQVGDPARPAALRVYVAGEGDLSVPQDHVSANLYAPRSNVVLLGKSDFYGSAFGRTVSSLKDISVHYDVAVQRVASACAGDEPSSCTGCGQCNEGRACVAGQCASCGADVDCCWPLVCEGGRCAAFKE